jgi:hypothetical protein
VDYAPDRNHDEDCDDRVENSLKACCARFAVTNYISDQTPEEDDDSERNEEHHYVVECGVGKLDETDDALLGGRKLSTFIYKFLHCIPRIWRYKRFQSALWINFLSTFAPLILSLFSPARLKSRKRDDDGKTNEKCNADPQEERERSLQYIYDRQENDQNEENRNSPEHHRKPQVTPLGPQENEVAYKTTQKENERRHEKQACADIEKT